MVSRMMWFLPLCLAVSVFPCFAATFDVASDFSPVDNPTGTWCYGWSSQLTSALDLYSFNGNDRDIDLWADSGTLYPPTVSHNGTGNEVTTEPEMITWQPGQFALHPGGGGEYSHARWTASAAGVYTVTAEFTGIDHVGPTTDVHVLYNNIDFFSGSVVGFGDMASFEMNIWVEAGDFIDFAVGFGAGGYFHDTTALAATISDEISGVDDGMTVLKETELVGIYPNPFNPQTTIKFSLANNEQGKINVYDLSGRLVRLLANRTFTAGDHSVLWNGENTDGRSVPAGSYIIRLVTEEKVEARKVMLIR